MRKTLFLLIALFSVMIVSAQDENTFVTDDGLVSITYPASWFAGEEDGDVLFANSEAALGLSGDLITPGDISGRILIFAFDELADSGLDESSSAAELAQLFIASFTESDTASFLAAEPFDVGSNDGALSIGTVNPSGKIVDAYVVAVKDDQAFALILIVMDGGNPTEVEQILSDVGASFDYDAGSDTSVFPNSVSATDPNAGDFTVSYPDGWVYEIVDGNQIQIANSEDALRNFVDSDGVPLEGQVGANVLALPKGVLPQLGDYPDTPDGVLAFLEVAFANDEVFDVVFDEPTSITINDRPAAMVYGELSQAEGEYNVMLIAVDIDVIHGVLAFVAEAGMITEYEQLGLQIASSFRAGATDTDAQPRSTAHLTNNISTLDATTGFITIHYPADWSADVIDGEIIFGNSPEAIANFADAESPIQPGDIAGNVFAMPYNQLVGMGFDESASGMAEFVKQVVFGSDATTASVGEPETLILEDEGIVVVSGATSNGSLTLDIIVTVTDTGNGYVMILFGMDAGAAPDVIDLAIEIAAAATIE